MTYFEVFRLFGSQLERHIASQKFATKIVLTPSSIEEKGLVIKLSLLKCYPQTIPALVKAHRMIRVRVSVAGTAESLTGLEQACDAIAALDCYLGCKPENSRTAAQTALLLEDDNADPVPNTRITAAISPEDSFIDSPDSVAVQDVQDDRTVTITFPWED